MTKKRLGTVWLAGCSGCHMSLLDIDERILDVLQLADIIKSPVVDGKEFENMDIVLIEGAVAHDEHIEEVKKIRERTKIVVSFGDCAVNGNVAAIRNQVSALAALEKSYVTALSNAPGSKIPMDVEVPKLLDRVVPVHEIIKVDYFIPGCPPSADLIFYVVAELLNDRVPNLQKGKLKYG